VGKVLIEWLLADYITIQPSLRHYRHLAVAVAVKKENKKLGDIIACLEKQDDYTLHRPVRKRFARNHYSVSNVMDDWECDLVDVRALGKFKD